MKVKWASSREVLGCFYSFIMSLEVVLGPVLGGNFPLLHQEAVPSWTAGQGLGSNIFTYRGCPFGQKHLQGFHALFSTAGTYLWIIGVGLMALVRLEAST